MANAKDALLERATRDPFVPAPAKAAPDPVPEGWVGETYYNPWIMDERFPLPGTVHLRMFRNGVFVPRTPGEEGAVRAALRAHGPDKPDRWKGGERRKEWRCRKCGFHTLNDDAADDHESRGLH